MNAIIKFTAADLSATQRSEWIEILPQTKRLAIHIGCTADDAPTGTITIEVSGHGINGTAGSAYVPAPTIHPAGAAFTAIYDNIETSARFICVVYTVTSGGSGATWTNDSGVLGSIPFVAFKE